MIIELTHKEEHLSMEWQWILDFGSDTLSLENQPESGRELPPIPEDGMLESLDHESKLHAWLLQGMTKTVFPGTWY